MAHCLGTLYGEKVPMQCFTIVVDLVRELLYIYTCSSCFLATLLVHLSIQVNCTLTEQSVVVEWQVYVLHTQFTCIHVIINLILAVKNYYNNAVTTCVHVYTCRP